MKNILLLALLNFATTSCLPPTGPGPTIPEEPYQDCYWVYDIGYGEWNYHCDWVYYNSQGEREEIDIASDIADKNEATQILMAQNYQNNFSLSQESALKMAKVVFDYNKLSERTEQDIADFAQRLYGVNPNEIIEAISNAQVGQYQKLNEVIEKASNHLNTNTYKTKKIIRYLHGQALEENGIQL